MGEATSELERLEHLLLRVLEAPEARRAGVLEAACREAPEFAARLRTRVAQLKALGLLKEPSAAGATLPERIGGYRILGVLGQGGMGVVYRAVHEQLERHVALKCILPELVLGGRARERFRREAQALAQIQHPGLATLYEAGEWEGQPFLALQLVEGESLEASLARARALGASHWRRGGSPSAGVRDAVACVAEIARAVHAVHEAGLLHRDLKPSNILLTPEGRPVLIDLGLARLLADDPEDLTRSSDVVGTPAYMAPEQVDPRSRALGRPTDVHALGAVLYECLTLRAPHAGGSRAETYRRILSEAPVELRRLQPLASRDLASVVEKALEKEPQRRFATAAELAEELELILRGEPTRTRPVGPVRRVFAWARAHRATAAFLVTLFLSLSVGLAVAFRLLRRANAAVLTYEALDALRRDSALAAVLAEEALAAGGGVAARNARVQALRDLRLVESHAVNGTPCAIAADEEGALVAVGLWEEASELKSTLVLRRRGSEIARVPVYGRTRRLDLDARRGRLLAIGSRPAATLVDLEGRLIALLHAHPEVDAALHAQSEVDAALHAQLGVDAALLAALRQVPGHRTIGGGLQAEILFTATDDGWIRYFDLDGRLREEGSFRVPCRAGRRWISVARHPRSGELLLGDDRGRVVRVDTRGREVYEVAELPGPATFVSYAPSGGRLLAATGWRRHWSDIDAIPPCDRHTVLIVEEDGRRVPLSGHGAAQTSVSWSPDAKRVLTTSEDALAIVHDLEVLDESGRPRRQHLFHPKSVDEGCFLGDGERLATRMSTLHVSVWHRRGLHLGDLLAGDSGAFAFAATGDGERLLTGSVDKCLALWDTRSRLVEEHVSRTELRDAFFAADEEQVWVLTSEDELELVNCACRTVRRSIDLRGALAQGDHGSSAVRAADGAIVVGTERGRCLVVDAESHAGVPAVREISPHQALAPTRITSIQNAGGKMAFFRAGSGEVALWDPAMAEAGTLVRRIPSEVISVAVQPEEGLTAWGTAGAIILEAPGGGGGERGPVNLGHAVMGLAWSDRSHLLAATAPGEIVCFDDELRTVWKRMTGVQIFRLAIAPAAGLIAAGCGDRRTRLFDLAGEPVIELPAHYGGVRNLEFSRDGRRLLITTTAGHLLVWRVDAFLGSGDLLGSVGPYRAAIEEARSRRARRG